MANPPAPPELPPHPWTSAHATIQINRRAKSDLLELSYGTHVRQNLLQRNLIVDDLLYVLQTGFVYDPPEESTRPDFWKYRIEGPTPNTDKRILRVVVIPGDDGMKVVTIMWRD